MWGQELGFGLSEWERGELFNLDEIQITRCKIRKERRKKKKEEGKKKKEEEE